MTTPDELRSHIAQGWVALTFCVVGGFLADLMKSGVHNDFSKWADDPGPGGLKVVAVVIALYIFMPMLVHSARATWLRWLLVGITVFFGLFFVAHQVAHALTGTRPFDIVHVFDFAHHVLSVWLVVLTARWARLGPTPAMQPVAATHAPSLAR